MKKFLATLIALFLGVSLAACSNTNVENTTLIKQENGIKKEIVIKYEGNRVLKTIETTEGDYSAVEGGRKKLEKEEREFAELSSQIKGFNKVYSYSTKFNKNTYKTEFTMDVTNVNFKEQSDILKYLGYKVSDDYIDYSDLVNKYEKVGYVKE